MIASLANTPMSRNVAQHTASLRAINWYDQIPREEMDLLCQCKAEQQEEARRKLEQARIDASQETAPVLLKDEDEDQRADDVDVVMEVLDNESLRTLVLDENHADLPNAEYLD